MKGEPGGSHTQRADHHCILCCRLLYSQGLLSCSPEFRSLSHSEETQQNFHLPLCAEGCSQFGTVGQ